MKIAVFHFAIFGINTYVVFDPDTKECAVIDPAMINTEEEDAMTGFIEKNGLLPTHIINTHLHIDHAIGNAFMKKTYGTPILGHKDDENLGERMQDQARMFGLNMQPEGIKITHYLDDGDTVKIGNGKLHVLHVPGHSRGSIALWDKEDGFVIAGDALFQGSIGRTDLPGGNHQQLINSINDKLMTLPDSTVVYPGHGDLTTIGEERKHNPYLL